MIHFIIIVLAAYVGGYIVSFLYGEWRYRKACCQDLSECPPHSNTKEYAKRIGRFFAVRSWICNSQRLQEPNPSIRKHTDKFKLSQGFATGVYKGNAFTLITFIRLCHALGCTVYVRQTNFEGVYTDTKMVAAMDEKYHCTEYMFNSKLDKALL